MLTCFVTRQMLRTCGLRMSVHKSYRLASSVPFGHPPPNTSATIAVRPDRRATCNGTGRRSRTPHAHSSDGRALLFQFKVPQSGGVATQEWGTQ